MAEEKQDFTEHLNEFSSVKHVIAVMSGKGGVGKSFVTSRLAALFQKKGYRTAVLDADITGPSIPRCFGLTGRVEAGEKGLEPAVTDTGIQVMSLNLLLDDEEAPVIWRGPIIAGTVKQFYTDVYWNDVDYMFVDMPPGTGDVPLTVFQSLPVDGIVIVTSPQDLVSMIVGKAVNMANAMGLPVLGIVENYSFIKCPDCGKVIYPFGEGKTEDVAKHFNLPVLAKLPIDPSVSEAMDSGMVEHLSEDCLTAAVPAIEKAMEENEKAKAAAAEAPASDEEVHTVAVPVGDDGKVWQHFGKTTEFVVYKTKGKDVLNRDAVNCDGYAHESLADLLAKEGVDVLICGGIGPGGRDAVISKGIKIVPGIMGMAEDAVQRFINGELSYSNDSTCAGHGDSHSES